MTNRDRRRVPAQITDLTPIPVSVLSAADDHADRVDGPTGEATSRGYRRRTKRSASPTHSVMQRVTASVARDDFWTLAERLDQLIPLASTGRPRQYRLADVLVAEQIVTMSGSQRAGVREAHDLHNWNRLRTACEHAWPDHHERRLSSQPPSRNQMQRARQLLTGDPTILDDCREHLTRTQVEIARTIGCFNDTGSTTHPSPDNTIAGDATWIPGRFNTSDTTQIDTTTGEIRPRRHDPDTAPFHRDGSAPGNYLVSVLTRTNAAGSRVILDATWKPDGISDGDVFTELAITLKKRIPEIAAATYDMALDQHAANTLITHKIQPITKVRKNRHNTHAIAALGNHTFTTQHGDTYTDSVSAVGGVPAIEVIIDGEQQLQPLERVTSHYRDNTDGTATLYVIWRIPDTAPVPPKQRHATVRIRHNATDTELTTGRLRTRALRPIPPADPDFDALFGRREDTESMHNHLKDTLHGRRARSIGLAARTLDHLAYQFLNGTDALLNTELSAADWERHFGRWKPPERVRAAA